MTTAYYLALKKLIKEGGPTNCDIASKTFDISMIEPLKRKEVNRSIVLMDNFMSKTS